MENHTGVVNPCFLVNDQFFVRFNTRDPGVREFRREERADAGGPESWYWLLAGYCERRTLTPEFERKNLFCQMHLRPELGAVSHKHWLGKASWGERNHARILERFDACLADLR